MKYVLALLLGIGCLGVVACQTSEVHERRLATLQVQVVGMTCPVGCPPRVEAALASVPGVESATVDYEHRTATVVAAADVDRHALVAALEKQGFGGSIL